MWLILEVLKLLAMGVVVTFGSAMLGVVFYLLFGPHDLRGMLRRWWRRRQVRRYTRKVLKKAREQQTDAGAVSERWLRDQQQQTSRIEFHSPTIAFPIRKER